MPSMTFPHFVVAWATAQTLGKTTVLSTGWWCYPACYFHDIISWRNVRSGIVLPILAAAERRIFLRDFFAILRQKNWRAFVMLSKRIASAPNCAYTPEGKKSCRMRSRLEALGAIGLARVLPVSGALGVALLIADDRFADGRPLNDKQFALDHFSNQTAETAADDADRTGQVHGAA